MNELFENEYKMENKLYKEYVYNVLCKKTIIIGSIIMILGIFMFFVMEQDKAYVMLTAGIIAGVASIMTPILVVKQLEKIALDLGFKESYAFLDEDDLLLDIFKKMDYQIVSNDGEILIKKEFRSLI